MVLEEGEEVARRELQRELGLGRPHGRDDGLHEVALEVGGEVPRPQEPPEGDVVTLGGEQRLGLPVEPRDLGQHAEVGRAAEVGGDREQPTWSQGAGPLQPGLVVAHRQRHLRLLRLDAELGEEAQQRRVGAPVVDDEAGVDREVADLVGVGVPAEPVVGLVERDLGRLRRDVRRHEPGHAGPDDGDPSWCCRAHAFLNSTATIGSVVGSSEPPSGSTVMPKPLALAASPSRRTSWSPPLISPAGTIWSSWISHSS